jgi:hypothetical protein
MSSEKYVKEAIQNVKEWMQGRSMTFKTKANGVLPSRYRPELDVTELCEVDEAEFYQQQISVLRWDVELGRLDITGDQASAYTAAPRVGHLKAVLHIFSYLNQHDCSKLVLDDSYVRIDDELECGWSGFYPNAREDIPNNVPEPRGNEVQMIAFVDADHAGDKITRRSRTSVLIYLNRSPIQWHCKKHNSVETSMFGSEFTAL